MAIARERLHTGQLVGQGLESGADAVRWFGALQAQDYYGAKWALSLRTGATDAELDLAFDRGEFLRTHLLRPTWHFVAPEDLRWLLALTAPRVHKASSHRLRQLELDEASLARGDEIIEGALAGRELTRDELAAELEANGMNVDGQRLPYLLMHAELEGIICSGPKRAKLQTYSLLEERVPAGVDLSGEEALAELARRYFTSHGPATPHDFAWWSGLTVTDARKGLNLVGSELEAVRVDGAEYWSPEFTGLASPGEAPLVHLLPNFDEQFVAYRDHQPSVDPREPSILAEITSRRVGPHLVSLDGLIVGGWSRKLRKERVEVKVDLLVRLEKPQLAALEEAALAYGHFLALAPDLQVNIRAGAASAAIPFGYRSSP